MGLGLLPQGVPVFRHVVLSCMGMAVMAVSIMFSIQMLAVMQTQPLSHLVGKVIDSIMTFIMCAQPIGRFIYGILFKQLSRQKALVMIGAVILSFIIALYSKRIVEYLGGK